jgi:hypothetical protein
MQNEGQSEYVGQASWFISHAWKCHFLEVTDAIVAVNPSAYYDSLYINLVTGRKAAELV